MYEYLRYAPVASFFLLITLVTSLYAFYADNSLFEKLMLKPVRVFRRKEYYRLFTAGLLHGDFFHLLFNLLTFYFFAKYVESYYLGHWQFAVVYVGSLLLSSLYAAWQHREDGSYNALGASGAVSGVLFSFILFNPNAMLGVMFIIPMPAWLFAILYLAFSYYFARQGGGVIGHDAHLAGALAGLVLTFVLYPPIVLQTAHRISIAIQSLLG
jgi:membrane associated rhomboid family serine protease